MYLAFDLGAESGRALLGFYRDGIISMREIHRFPNEPVQLPGSLHWDVLRLWREMQRGLALASAEGRIHAIGVDAWGVDFALLGERGQLLGNPFHYRDVRTDGVPERMFERVSAAEIYAATGIQFMQINSLVQLYAAQQQMPETLRHAKALLTIPDLFNYWLTGTKACEYSNATTTQMFDPRADDWARPLLERFGIPHHFLQPVVHPGTQLGSAGEIPVVAPACHDTGSAVAAIAMGPRTAFISSGTWSLMGAELAQPLITDEARRLNFTNEGGVCGTTRLLKNIMGMWLLQGCRKQWQAEGKEHDYAGLMGLATQQPSLQSLIDPDHASFFHPENMPEAIREYCRKTDQPVPASVADYVQCILESLALKYRYVLESLASLTGIAFDEIRVVGGGARNGVLNQFTADACGCTVLAGPVEATALGNLGIQMLTMGEFASLSDVRAAVDRSFPAQRFIPREREMWNRAYRSFVEYAGNRTSPAGV